MKLKITMDENMLIQFMKEVSTSLGSINQELKGINNRLDEGKMKMDRNDADINLLKDKVVFLEKADKDMDCKIKELQPLVDFGKTVQNFKRYLIFISVIVGAALALVEAWKRFF